MEFDKQVKLNVMAHSMSIFSYQKGTILLCIFILGLHTEVSTVVKKMVIHNNNTTISLKLSPVNTKLNYD